MGQRWLGLGAVLSVGLVVLGCQGASIDAARGSLEGSASILDSVVVVAGAGVICSGVAIGSSEIVTATPCVFDSRDAPSSIRVYPDGFAGGTAPGLDVAEVVVDTVSPRASTDGLYTLSVLRTSTAHGVPVATRASASPAVDDAVMLVGFGNSIADATFGETRREAAAMVIALDHLPALAGGEILDTFETAPPAVCDADGGGGVFAADGSLVGVIQGGPDPCDGTPPVAGDGDNIIEIAAHATFLDDVLATPTADAGSGGVDGGMADAGGLDGGTGGGTDAGSVSDAGPGSDGDTGCGCRVVAPRGSVHASALGLALIGLLLARRRRR